MRDVDDSVVSKLLHELKQLDFECEIHPDFSFNDQSGFLPFKVKILKSRIPGLTGKEYRSGFELEVYDKNHNEVISKTNKQSFLDKLAEKKQSIIPTKSTLPEAIEKKLQQAKKELLFVAGGAENLEIIMAWYCGAILVDIYDGVLYDPQEDKYYDRSDVLIEAKNAFREHEAVNLEDWSLHYFEDWQ